MHNDDHNRRDHSIEHKYLHCLSPGFAFSLKATMAFLEQTLAVKSAQISRGEKVKICVKLVVERRSTRFAFIGLATSDGTYVIDLQSSS